MANTRGSLADIYNERDRWNQRLERARRRREVADQTVERCYKHLGSRVMVEQIAELLATHLPEYRMEVLGPFGLACETSIYAYTEAGGLAGSFGVLRIRKQSQLDRPTARHRRVRPEHNRRTQRTQPPQARHP